MGYDWRSLVERDFHPYSLLPGTRVSLWTAESPSTVRLKRLANQFEQECLPNRLVGTTSAGTLIAPSETLCALTNEAVQLLRNLLPHTTQSALEHVSILAWARIYTEDAHVESGTVRTIPGMIFLSPDNLPTPWRLAEAILHEAAHLKLFDLYLTSGILAGTYDALTSVRIKIPWNRPTLLQTNEWPVDQALAALHVYVHLAVLALAGGASPTVGSEAQPLFEKSIFRAHFLAQQLLSMEAQPLGGRGYAFVAWLGKLVDEITSVGYPMTSPESDQDEKVVPFERFVEATPGGGLAWSPQHEIVLLSAQAARLLDKRSRNLPLGEDAPLAERLAPLGIL
jgi:hypothetical protein